MSYSVQNIRNVCLLGHGGSGKTALTESLLYMTGAIDRMGKATDGNTVCDYDPEEVKRQISISTAVAPLEYKGCKINVLDAPGGFDFAGEVMEALTVADAAIIVCSAKDGISVGLEKAWKYCEERERPPCPQRDSKKARGRRSVHGPKFSYPSSASTAGVSAETASSTVLPSCRRTASSSFGISPGR